jgi:hypothetical protein
MARPRLTRAELRVLRDMLVFRRKGHYDAETNRWIYDPDLYNKICRILATKNRPTAETRK